MKDEDIDAVSMITGVEQGKIKDIISPIIELRRLASDSMVQLETLM